MVDIRGMVDIMDKVMGLAVAAMVMATETDTGSTAMVMGTGVGINMDMVIQVGNMVAIITVSKGRMMSTTTISRVGQHE